MSAEKEPKEEKQSKPVSTIGYVRLISAIFAGIFIRGVASAGGDYSAAVKLPISSTSLTLMLFGGFGWAYSELQARRLEKKAASASGSRKTPKEVHSLSLVGGIMGIGVAILGTVVVTLTYGFFVATYNVGGALGTSTLTGQINATAYNSMAYIGSFFGTTDSAIPLLTLIPLLLVAAITIYFVVAGVGGFSEAGV